MSHPFLIKETFVTVTTHVSDRNVIVTLCENHPSGSIKWTACVKLPSQEAAKAFANKFEGQGIPKDIKVVQSQGAWEMHLSMNVVDFKKEGEASKDLLLENIVQTVISLLGSSEATRALAASSFGLLSCGKTRMNGVLDGIFVTITVQVADRDVIVTLCENQANGSIKWRASVKQSSPEIAQIFASKFAGQSIPKDLKLVHENGGWEIHLSMNVIDFVKEGEPSKDLLHENLIQVVATLLGGNTANKSDTLVLRGPCSSPTFSSFDLLPVGVPKLSGVINDIFITMTSQASGRNVIVTLCENQPCGSIKWQATINHASQVSALAFANKFSGRGVADDVKVVQTSDGWEIRLPTKAIPFQKRYDASKDYLLENLTEAIATLLRAPASLFGLPLRGKAKAVGRGMIFSFGSSGSGESQFKNPRGIALNGDGNIIVSDTGNHRIQVFGKKGNFKRKFGTQGSGDGQLNKPCGVAIDGEGNIIVVDTGNNRIQMFDKKGVLIINFGAKGSADCQFNYPQGVAINGEGNIIISDSDNHRVQMFDRNGVFKRKFGTKGSGNGQFNFPHGIAIDGDGNIIVVDSGNCRVQTFDKTGTFRGKFGTKGSADGQFSCPQGVTIDGDGHIVIVDSGNMRIQMFDKGGNLKRKLVCNTPSDVSIDSEGNIVVVDYNGRVSAFN